MNPADHTLLAVDDNPINLKLLARLLANTKFNVLTASNGKEAIEVARKEHPDLVLLDVLMPEMDGYETCKVLKEDPQTSHVPVIFLSAKNESVDKAKGLSLGAVDYLIKPFDPVEILARIRLHIGMRSELSELHKQIEDLGAELKNMRRNGKATGLKPEQLQYLDGLKPTRFSTTTKYFQVASRTRFSEAPPTTVFLPVLIKEQQLIYLILGGFNKDYPTSVVQSMLEKYAAGYLAGIGSSFVDERSLNSLFEAILESFSPDITNVAFTISMGHVFASKSELTVFSIHQATPLIVDQQGVLVKGESMPVWLESKYARIIDARKIRLPKKATLLNYLRGRTVTAEKTFKEICLQHVDKENGDAQEIVDRIYNNLPENKSDQLVCAIKLV